MQYLKLLFAVAAGLFISGWWDPESARRRKRKGTVADEDDPDSPVQVSKSGWKEALKRTKNALKDKQLATQAAGLAYYTTLTFFPAIIGAATVYATFAGPEALMSVIRGIGDVFPESVYEIVDKQLSPLTEASRTTLGLAAVLSVLTLLWTTSGGLQNLVKATNYAYDERESRGLIKLRLLSLALSAVLLPLGTAILLLLLAQPDALQALGAPEWMANSFSILRWPLLVIILSVILALIYRYAPNRKAPKWSWVSWGAVAATVIWLAGTVAFFYYTQHFGRFQQTYGVFAGIVVLMVWFNLSALIVLIGAQVNRKLEDVSGTETQEG
jgi:membrane protein